MIHRDLTATTGQTPLVELGRIARGLPPGHRQAGATQPCGSVKDRLAVGTGRRAERVVCCGRHDIVEATGGNTASGSRSRRDPRLSPGADDAREHVAGAGRAAAAVRRRIVLTKGILMGDAVARAGS